MSQPWIPAAPVIPSAVKWNTSSRDVPPGPVSGIRVWDGSSWVLRPVKRWDGTSWVGATLKAWDGSEWVISS